MKVFVCCFFICWSFVAVANETNTICDSNSAVVLVVHKDKDGVVSENNGNHWVVTVDYDILSGGAYDGAGVNTVKGLAACSSLNIKSAVNGSTYNGGTAVPGDANSFVKMRAVNNGTRCWCRLNGPITSWWTFVHEYSDSITCAESCSSYCANGFAKNTQMSNGRYVRNALIDAVW